VRPVSARGAARFSVLSNSLLVLAKVGVGALTHSISVVAEGFHSALDLLASVLAYFSLREAEKPADETHPYGHGKMENLAGVAEALLILAGSAWIISESARRLLRGGEVSYPWAGLLVMGGSALLNYLISAFLFRVAEREHSIALKADALHLRTDTWTSLGVFAGLGLLSLTGRHWFDPLVALGVAVYIVRAGYLILRESLLPLLDVSLPPEEWQIIREVLDRYRDRYLEVHMVRTRRAGRERHVDLHLVLPRVMPLYEAHRLCDEIEEAIRERLPFSAVLIHPEPCEFREREECPPDCSLCPLLPKGEAGSGGGRRKMEG
jgi:cation diffusion facilitator family transporter